jgi:O-antigen ligase
MQAGFIRCAWSPVVGLAWLLWGWGWLSLAVSPHRAISMGAQWFGLHLVLLTILMPAVLRHRDDLRRFWIGTAVIGGVVAAIACAQWFGLDYERGIQWRPHQALIQKIGIYSTIGNPNYLAAVLVFLIPVMIVLAVGEKRARYRAALWGCAVISIVALLLTRSKGGLAAACVGCLVLWLVWALHYGWSTKRLFLSGAGGVGAAALLLLLMMWQMPLLGSDWHTLLSRSWDDPSVKGRLLMWKTTIEMVAAHPVIGIGTGTFGAQYQPYRARVFDRVDNPAALYPASEHSYDETGDAHNDWLQLAAENGIVGFALFTALIFYVFLGGLRLLSVLRYAPADSSKIVERTIPPDLLCGVLAGLAALLAHALVDFPLQQPAAALLFWLGLATIIAAGGKPLIWRLPVWFASGVAVLGAGLLASQAFRPVIAGAYQRDAWVLMSERQWAAAIPVIQRGLRWDPLQPDLTLYLGVASFQEGDLEGSRVAYERYELLYSDFQTLYNLGLIAVRQRQFDQAERYFREALRYKPTLAEAAAALSLVAGQMGRPDEARRYRQQAVQLRDAGG